LSYVDKEGEIPTVLIFNDKGPGKKKLHQNKSWQFSVLDVDDSDEDSAIGYETLNLLLPT
jgi:hypothetical protein